MNRRLFIHMIACTAIALLGGSAFAQTTAGDKYPSRPIRMIVAWAPGGGTDVATRILAQGLTQRLGVSVVVENRGGATGVIGTQSGAEAAPDGYTIMVGTVDTFEINPHVLSIKYDPLKSFEPIAPLGRLPLVVVASPRFKGSSATDVVKMAKADPGKLTYGTWGIGSLAHLGFAMFEQQAGIEMLHVPYTGGPQSVQALISSQIDLLVVPTFQADSLAKEGKLKIIGLTSAKRSTIFPGIPTMAEQGFKEYDWEQWTAFFFPAGTPRAMRDLIGREINGWLKTSEGLAATRQLGYEVVGGSPNDLKSMVVTGNERWSKVVRQRNIRVQ